MIPYPETPIARRALLKALGAGSTALALFASKSPAAAAAREEASEDAAACRATARDLEGPFHRPGAPMRTALAADDEPGERLLIHGQVFGPNCQTPLYGAMLDVWQADAAGNYDGDSTDYRLRGQLSTDPSGRYAFTTVRPGNYPDANGLRPAHIHFTITRPGYRPLTTQLYFRGDPYLGENDSCAPCNSEHPTLIVDLEPRIWEGDTWQVGRFDIVLAR